MIFTPAPKLKKIHKLRQENVTCGKRRFVTPFYVDSDPESVIRWYLNTSHDAVSLIRRSTR